MENHQNEPSLSSSFSSVAQDETQVCKDYISQSNHDLSLSGHHYVAISPQQCLVEKEPNVEITKGKDEKKFNECSPFKERMDDSSELNFILCDEEKSIEGLLQSIDVSDLSFFSNDFSLGDCNCLEQASQLVDPALRDCESTPFSFNINNSDLVQLLKSGLNDSNKDYTNLNLNNNLSNLSQKNNKRNERFSHKCNEVGCLKDEFTLQSVESESGGHESVTGKKTSESEMIVKNRKESPKDVKKVLKGSGLIKRGRRYLPNFKQKVLEYAKNHTYKETASHFQINSNTITEWFREAANEKARDKSSMESSKNHKTDKLGTPTTKTEIILLNDDICLETDNNEPTLIKNNKNIETSSSSSSSSKISTSATPLDVKPDEMFLKWIRRKRVEKKELSRQEVFQIAKYCLNKNPNNSESSSWFLPWLNRYNKVLNSVNSNVQMEKYIKYPSSFKLEVVLYARSFTKNSAARVFNVSRKRTFDWYRRLLQIDQNKTFDLVENDREGNVQIHADIMEFGVRKDETREKIYSELHLWYQKMFFDGTRPTSNDIKEKAREIFSFYGMKEIKFSDGWLQKFCQRTNIKLRHSEDDELLLWVLTQFDNNVSLSHQDITEKSSSLIGRKRFKGSKGWTLRFLKRHRNLLQRSPTFADQLPRAAEEKLTSFWNDFRRNIISFKVKPENIGCMDEIPLSFNYPEGGNSTYMPLLRKTGFENCQGIVILSSLANGRLLPPVVVFKGTEPKKLFSIRNLDILVLHQEKGLITADIIEVWMNQIWFSFVSSPSALIVDSFEPHTTKNLSQMLAKENCLLHVIPEGCSSKFQPLDVNVTPSFKEAMKSQWKEFSADSRIPPFKSEKKYRCPDRETILHWIRNAYEKVEKNPISITNSFKTTGLLQSKT